MNREQLKHLAVSATVTFPATFPRLAELRLRQCRAVPPNNGEQETSYLVAIERPSVRVTMNRVLPLSDVRAIFIPRDRNCVHPEDGTWLLGSEIEIGIRLQITSHNALYGIVYVAEQTATLLEVQAGMTAAESAQYYPPLPCDRSVNHYDPYRQARARMPAESGHEFPERRRENDPFLGEPSACESHHEFAGSQQVGEPFMSEPSACEDHHDFPPPGTPDYRPDYPFSAPRAFRSELEGHQQETYQTLRPREAFEPAPFPSEEATR